MGFGFILYMGNVKKICVSRLSLSAGNVVAENLDAIAYMVKDKYTSSCVLNYTKNRLAKELGVSVTMLHKAVRYGIATRRCRIEYGNLIFCPIYGERNVWDKELPKTFKEMKLFLKSIVIIDKLRKMKFMRHLTLLEPKVRGIVGECVLNGRNKGSGALSYKGIARILKISAKTAVKVMRFAVAKNLLTVVVTPAKRGLSISQSGSFRYKGMILCQPSNFYAEVGGL